MISIKISKLLKTLPTILFMVATSCATPTIPVTVYDKEVCVDLSTAGAHCNHTLTDSPRDITKAQWDKDRVGELCTTSQGFTDTETTVNTFCSDYPGVCDYETRQAIQTATAHLRGLILKAQAQKYSKDHGVTEPAE